jgi:hypothetical protein
LLAGAQDDRPVGPMHVAEAREKARANLAFGLHKSMAYFRDVAQLPWRPWATAIRWTGSSRAAWR